MNKENLNKWFLVDIIVKDITLGPNIINFIKTIEIVENYKFGILDNIEGVGRRIDEIIIMEYEDTVFELKELFKSLETLDLVWCDIYLFKEYPSMWINNRIHKEYPILIKKSDALVKVDDGFMISLYTPNANVVEAVKSHYPIKAINYDYIENLPFAAG